MPPTHLPGSSANFRVPPVDLAPEPEAAKERPKSAPGVRHVDLSVESGAISQPTNDFLVAFWWKDFPVGHLWLDVMNARSADRSGMTDVPADILDRARRITEAEAAQPPNNDCISVVICTRDRPEALARCLASFSEQTVRPRQIIVVDNASKDGRTRDVARAAGVDYVREDRPGLDIARNAGALAASGDIIAYTDDDVELHPRWLERLVRAFDGPEIMAVTGLVLPAELSTPAQRHFEKYWGFGRGYRVIDFGREFFASDRAHGCPAWNIGAGANMAFRRSAFQKAGLFDERLDVGAAGCSGDSEFWHRILTQGGACRYEPGAVVFHYHRKDMTGLASQLFHYMRGHSAALLVQYERSGNLGNLRRTSITLPLWFGRRILKRALKGPTEDNLFLKEELSGYLSGIRYYSSRPRLVSHWIAISVIVPAKNAEATLGRTLDSLLEQTESRWQAIVVDDGSTDRTHDIALTYAARDRRFRVVSGPKKGASAARNAGLAQARGDRVLFLDSDDWLAPRTLEMLAAKLDAHPDAAVAYCGYQRVTESGDLTEARCSNELETAAFEAMARRCAAAIHCVLIERALVVELGGFDESLRTCEDWDLWQRVARTGASFVCVPQALAFYRMSQSSLTRNILPMIADARVVIARGFASDERVKKPVPAYAAGANSGLGRPELALSFFTLWCAAHEAGRSLFSKDVFEAGAVADFADNVAIVAEVIFDALVVGARCTPADLASRWQEIGPSVRSLLAFLEQASSPGSARRVQYALERRILSSVRSGQLITLDLTAKANVNLRHPERLNFPATVDRLILEFHSGTAELGRAEIPVFGPVQPSDIAEAALASLGPRVFVGKSMVALRPRAWGLGVGAAWCALAGWLKAPSTQSFRTLLRTEGRAAALGAFGSRDERSNMAAIDKAIDDARDIDMPRLEISTSADTSTAAKGAPASDRRHYWEALFETPDPWNYGSDYERVKYDRTLALVPVGVELAMELACAEGRFTERLARAVGHLTAADISETALARARERCAGLANVSFQRLDLIEDAFPTGLDLIVCSEVLYYLDDRAKLQNVCRRLADALAPGGHLLAAHAYVLSDDLSRTGFDWHDQYGVAVIAGAMATTPGLVLESAVETDLYRIELYRRLTTCETPRPPQVTHLPVGAKVEPDVARSVVWGGAELRRVEACRLERTERLPILMYHRIAEDGPEALARYRVAPDKFQAQMRWLRRHGYYAVSAADAARHLQRKEPFPGRPVVITFDDGTVDFYDTAWPILRDCDFSADVFVVTDLVGRAAEWDATFGTPTALMSSRQISDLAEQGVHFGSHLASHRAADGLTSDELVRELAQSQALVSAWTGKPVLAMAAPFGVTDERLLFLARRCGYEAGLTTRSGIARLGDDPLSLPRIEVWGDWSEDEFAATLSASR